MTNFLVNMARKGAGVAPYYSPRPARETSFYTKLKEGGSTREGGGEFEPGISGHVRGDEEQSSAEASIHRPSVQLVPQDTEAVYGAERFSQHKSNAGREHTSVRFADSINGKGFVDRVSGRGRVSNQLDLPQPTVHAEEIREGESGYSGREPSGPGQSFEREARGAGADEKRDERKSVSDPGGAESPYIKETHLSTGHENSEYAGLTLSSKSQSVERESVIPASTEKAKQLMVLPQSAGSQFEGPRLFEAAPVERELRIEIRIGRVEVRLAQPPPPIAPPVKESTGPRGFKEYARRRRYLDRNWY